MKEFEHEVYQDQDAQEWLRREAPETFDPDALVSQILSDLHIEGERRMIAEHRLKAVRAREIGEIVRVVINGASGNNQDF